MDNGSPKFCMRCGNPVQVGEAFCGKCGARQGATEEQLVNHSKKKHWRVWIGVGVATSIVAAVVLTVVLFGMAKKSRTVMVYMIGSDLESEGSAASLDINEMKNATFDTENVKVLVYTGGAKQWALDEISADENAIFEVSDGSINKVQVYDKNLMTRPENIIDFVDYAYENYAADLYDLILWDHGGGPVYGYGADENSLFGSPMSVPTLARALADTKLVKSGKKFDLIGFDACLMGSAEVAKAVAPYGDYLIASEEVEPGDGWNYDFLNDFTSDNLGDTKKLGENIISHYTKYYEEKGRSYDLSLSMVDLSKVGQVAEAMDKLFTLVKDELTAQNYSAFSRQLTREKVYGYNGRDNQSYDLVDLEDLCNALSESHKDEVENIKANLKNAIIYSKSNIENTNGLSVYFLNYNKKEANEMMAKYRDVAFSDKYYQFLDKYKGFVVGERKVSRELYTDLKEEEKDGGIEIELDDELKENYQSGEIIIYRKLGDNKFMPVYRSSEVELVGNKLRATTYDLQFVIEVDKNGKKDYGWSFMYEKERTDEYADYATFGVLYYEDRDSLIGFSPKNYEMHIRIPKGSKEAEIRDIRLSSGSELASKTNFDLGKIEIIDFLSGTYKLFNNEGVLDYNMESYGTLYGTEVSLKDGEKYKIMLAGLDFDYGNIYEGEFSNDTADYYASFVVHDTQGDSHKLNLVHINNK